MSVTLRGVTYTPPQDEVPFTLGSMAPPRRRHAGLIVTVAVVSAVVLLGVATVIGWTLASHAGRDDPATAPAAAGMATAVGAVELQRGQFVWNSTGDPTCEGLQGFADIRGGTQVTVTDASGKVLAIGSLARGIATGITTESDGLQRATICTLHFTVPDVPRGAGPYGVEVAHRGVMHYDEGQLGTIRVGF